MFLALKELIWFSVEQDETQVWWPHFDYKIVVLSQATGTISNGNKLIDFFWQAFETWLTIGNELGPEVACDNTTILWSKPLPNLVHALLNW